MDPDWLTFTSDSKSVYVACAGSNHVSVVDVKSVKETTRNPGRRSAEAEHHGDPAVRPVAYSTIACMTAFSKSRIS